jgi:dTDP-4-amino-4,6-dideoxygalactose transaminase
MHIPLIKPDLPSFEDLRLPFEEIVNSGQITNFGKYVGQFEASTGAYLGTQTLAISSGTLGLVFALTALDLAPEEKVIFPSFTFPATAQAVLYAGGVPIFAEIDDDLNVATSDVAELLEANRDVGAVIAIHMYGLPARTQELEDVVAGASRRRGRKIALIFDAAHAFGSAVNGKRVGGSGDAEVFSLSATKLLVAGEGGLIAAKDPNITERVRCMRNYGISSDYNARFKGMNGKMSEFHAILGLQNLRRLDMLLLERQERARKYRDKIERTTRFRVTSWPREVVHTFKDFTILVPEEASDTGRNAVMRFLKECGIETRAYFFPPVHEQTFFRRFATRALPITQRLSRRVITLPFFTTISDQQIDYVVEKLKQAERQVL